MSIHPIPTEPLDLDAQRAEDAQYFRGYLHELIEISADMARMVHQQAKSQAAATPPETEPAAAPAPDLTIRFERIARTIRHRLAWSARSDPSQTANRANDSAKIP